ncbi:hydantoinase/oxoprolinase family protein [Roseisalinus antarcticus]|uniref:Acetophenone carboxylase gamma subunit n=1 Tax=Roseisalinus antarcticus TaxID=254357 RepID=A0A1Y5T0W7_9RHOB|nr:hydantoinase/oxoprolinase family protein [Roseisalinus antarcticus]SLN53452.1 Acetophenone carboxylase gamma subunit [Roseisalinus antarcticus]
MTADYRIAVDIGGTFVDAVELDMATGAFRFEKAPTTPGAPAEGVIDAVGRLRDSLEDVSLFIHGTTLGLNAVLERRGALTAILTNHGFRDIFLIGRGNVPDAHMYDFQYQRPDPIVRRRHIFGVPGRFDYKGREITPLDEDAVRAAARALVEDMGIEAIAVTYLFSFRNPAHERRTAEIIREMYPAMKVSISSDITREHREYERTSTTVLDAYVRPIFERYIDELRRALEDRAFAGRFAIMRSGGGAMSAEAAKSSPTQTVLSGPAGGLVGGALIAEVLEQPDLVTFDIGGTSLDVCLIERTQPKIAHEASLEELPLLIPSYDIRTIGSGGGSIASMNLGLLKVGPRSASAEPGPICYGRGGTEPTVTDAAVVLGYMDPESFLSGRMPLDADGAFQGIADQIAAPLGLDPVQAAARIFDVSLAKNVGAVRQLTVERGRDPSDFSLLAFGGAGPLIGPLAAREMGLKDTIVPQLPSGFSAWGMLGADIVDDFAQTDLTVLGSEPAAALDARFGKLEEEAMQSLLAQGVKSGDAMMERQLELRYMGQEHALTLTVGATLDAADLVRRFAEAHEGLYGHSMEAPVQILTTRVRGIGRTRRPTLVKAERPADPPPPPAPVAHRSAFDFATRSMTSFAVYDRDALERFSGLAGPALIDEGTSVTVVHSDQSVSVNAYGHLIIANRGAGA